MEISLFKHVALDLFNLQVRFRSLSRTQCSENMNWNYSVKTSA